MEFLAVGFENCGPRSGKITDSLVPSPRKIGHRHFHAFPNIGVKDIGFQITVEIVHHHEREIRQAVFDQLDQVRIKAPRDNDQAVHSVFTEKILGAGELLLFHAEKLEVMASPEDLVHNTGHDPHVVAGMNDVF